MYFKQTLVFIVLMFVCFPTLGFPADWRGRYSDELYEDSGRFRPYHLNTSVWILDSGESLDFGSAWGLYNASQNIGKWKSERDLLDLYFSPRWRQVPVIVESEKVIDIEDWQVPVDRKRQLLSEKVIEDWQVSVDMSRRFLGAMTLPPEPLRQQQMVLIPAGKFQMGNNDEDSYGDDRPVRTVYVDAFYMDTTEVTNAQFKAFVDANPVWQKDRIDPRFAIREEYLRDWKGNNYPKGRGNYPVTFVSWYAAMAYAEWVGKRLPTEAEWEYAARGGLVGKKYPNGDTMTPKDANYSNNHTTTVARYAVNGYGLYDMAGNVWEWCLDAYHEEFYATFPQESVARNPLSGANDMEWLLTIEWLLKNWKTANGKRVLRGGCFLNSPKGLRVALRNKAWGKWANNAFGFRCVMDVPTQIIYR